MSISLTNIICEQIEIGLYQWNEIKTLIILLLNSI